MAKPARAALAQVEPAAPEPPPAAPDLTGATDLRGWWLPYIIAVSGSQSFMLGSHLTSGTDVSGIVRRVAITPAGVCWVGIEQVGPDNRGKPLKWMIFLEGHGIV